MRKIREILRLHYEQKLGQRQIARSVNVSQSTVHDYLSRASAASLTWPPDQSWDDDRKEAALFPPNQETSRSTKWPAPDFPAIRLQLRTHRELTLELLWEEYRQQHPDGYCYSRFCKLYRRWNKQHDVVARRHSGSAESAPRTF